MQCTKCQVQYVGHTIRRLKDRVREHIFSTENTNRETPVGKHFLHCCNSNTKYLCVQVIEKVCPSIRQDDLLTAINHREAFWIFQLGNRSPEALTKRWDINCFVQTKNSFAALVFPLNLYKAALPFPLILLGGMLGLSVFCNFVLIGQKLSCDFI
ncbi:hypothetical protein XELAEV_18007451mg [Xenopus laevis]|uniref:GIY-YIG domain-containing protein n=1 Tax=Xenopus laevis TaxID=8355 RepID=A0A974I5D2_XENLA|nr:hypothetical protein XELAEV_18007451mg [Xenopus laevis]